MLASDRHQEIVRVVETEGSASVESLRQRIQISRMTLWRDLRYLEEAGLVHRVHGGVIKSDFTSANELRFNEKQMANENVKAAIAQYAAERFAGPGDILCLEGGTTVTRLVRHLRQPNVTILTNSLQVASEAARETPQLTLISSGGLLRPTSETFVGPEAERFFTQHSADTLFLSGTGLTIEQGITDPNPLEIQAKQAMIASARRVIALIDSSKFGKRSLMSVTHVGKLDVLVTDAAVPSQVVDAIRQLNVDVRIVT